MKQSYRGGLRYAKEQGFALPTLLIASVVMLIVLLAAVQTVVASRLGIQETYYSQLASEAAEAGLVNAEACIKANASYNAAWSNANPLNTGDDCSGNPISGAPTTVVSQTDPFKVETSYSVAFPDNSQNPVVVEATGTIELKRKSNDTVWKSYNGTRKMSLSRGVKKASQFSSGTGFSCAIFDGETWCFGRNYHGTLGVGKCHTTTNRATVVPNCNNGTLDTSLEPLRVVRQAGVLEGKTDRFVAAGDVAACVAARDSGGNDTIYCWGDNGEGGGTGQLGIDNTSEKMYPYPTQINMTLIAGKEVTDLQAGKYRMCAAAGGDVYCWGYGSYAALGRGGTNLSWSGVPVQVQGVGISAGRPVKKIATAPDIDTTCAIIDSGASAGQVYCWGSNLRGQLGIGTINTGSPSNPWSTTAVRAGTLTNITSIVGGGGVTNQATNDDRSNGSPSTSLGVDSTTKTYVGRIAKAQFCAIDTSKQLWCWGANQFGQLGIGLSVGTGATQLSSDAQIAPRYSRSLSPVQPTIQLAYDTYSASYTYPRISSPNPAVETPTVTCYNTTESLPLGSCSGGITMNNVEVEQVAISYGSTCVLVSAPESVAGKVFCAGYNDFGIGRNGRFSSTSTSYNNDLNQIAKNYFYQMILKNVPSDAVVESVTGNTNRMCVIAGGRLYCMGNNLVGQLGTGDTTSYLIPTEAKVLRRFDTFQIY